MASKATPEKTLSSRVMDMKFMRRSSGNAFPSTPSKEMAERPSKRKRLSDGSALGTSPAMGVNDAQHSMPASVRSTKDDILAQQAEEAGDTKWTLEAHVPQVQNRTAPVMNVAIVGYSTIDASRPAQSGENSSDAGEDPAEEATPGRKSFGRFNKKIEVCSTLSIQLIAQSNGGEIQVPHG